MSKTKYMVTMLTAISLGGVAYKQSKEGTLLKPYKDSGGVPTIATGATYYEDGTKVKMTDPPITKKRAAQLLKIHMAKDSRIFNKTLLNILLSQDEYDLYLDFTYQYGIGTWSKSVILKKLKAGKYTQACKALLKYKYVKKKDCSIRKNNCFGVWARINERYKKCMGAQ